MRLVITLPLVVVLLTSCITVQSPEGITTTRVDTEATIAILQASVAAAQYALNAYIQFATEQQRLEDEETQREIARQQQRIDMLLQVLNTLSSR